MERKRGIVVEGRGSGGTVQILEEFYRLKSGTGWAPEDWNREDDDNYEKWYLVISGDIPCGGPEPEMKKAENIKILPD